MSKTTSRPHDSRPITGGEEGEARSLPHFDTRRDGVTNSDLTRAALLRPPHRNPAVRRGDVRRRMSPAGVNPKIAQAAPSIDSAHAHVRDSMRCLPEVLQLPLTLLTGRPYTGQRPLQLRPTLHLIAAVASLSYGLIVSGFALGASGWSLVLLPTGWALTLHGMRNLRMMVYHQCAHGNMWRRGTPDRLLGKLVSGLLMVQEFERYSDEHVRDHHASHHMSLRDPTVQAFLVSLELRPGMSRQEMWQRVLRKLCSPVFHLRFTFARIRSYFYASSVIQRLVTASAYGAAATIATVVDGWVFVLVAWLLPITLFFQVSNTLRLCVKHTFPPANVTKRRGKEYFASLTNAVFLGEPVPARDLPPTRRAIGWARWWLRMLCVHLPGRYLVLTGDTVCHDYHHRHPMSREWSNYIFARQADLESGHHGWPPYREVWGLVPAVNVVFDSIAAADPWEYDRARLAAVSQRQLFAAFDD